MSNKKEVRTLNLGIVDKSAKKVKDVKPMATLVSEALVKKYGK